MAFYLTAFSKCTTPFEKSDDGEVWGFSEYAELIADPAVPLADAVKKLDAVAGKFIVKWCRLKPFPHYRVTRRWRTWLMENEAVVIDGDRRKELVIQWKEVLK